MAKTGHYEQWRTDFDMVKEMGMEFLRDGPPCYCTHTAAGVYDWNITDITFNKLHELGITLIVDLCHFRVPDWIGKFQNPEFPN